MTSFTLDPERSTIVIEARSTAGPIYWEAVGPHGEVELELADGTISPDIEPRGSLELDLTTLTSGNALYDAELQRRINSRRFPTASVELHGSSPVSAETWHLTADVTLHGTTQRLGGNVLLEIHGDRELMVTGEHAVDIRKFGIPQPTMLMLKIFPVVTVRLFLAAVAG